MVGAMRLPRYGRDAGHYGGDRDNLMSRSTPVRVSTVRANGLELTVLEAGSGPLALCLHGFPDTANTWRYLLPVLAEAGFHAVTPFMRGCAPPAEAGDGCYQLGSLLTYTS